MAVLLLAAKQQRVFSMFLQKIVFLKVQTGVSGLKHGAAEAGKSKI